MTDTGVIIAGGGIGGLSAALSLARNGIASTVLEQSAKLGEIGAGIQIGPNAFHCFDYLDIGDEARRVAVYIDRLRFMNAQDGDEICHIPLDDQFRERFGNPYAVVHRADLHGVLLQACRANERVTLRTSSRVVGYEQNAGSVRVRIEGGDIEEGNVLVGADGLHSPVRAQLVGDGEPRVSGHATYRSVIPADRMPDDLKWNAATLWAGPLCHIVHYPLKGGEVFNLVVTYHRDMKEAVAGKPVDREQVSEGFEHVHPRARQVIERGENWKLWVLCDRDPIVDWVDGRVTLLGDAAHPMLQYFAQGACMAMEDGVCLGHMMRIHERPQDALDAYCNRRMVRTARVQLGARIIGDYIYHPSGAAAKVRDHVMGSKTPGQWYDDLEWLYGGNGLEAG